LPLEVIFMSQQSNAKQNPAFGYFRPNALMLKLIRYTQFSRPSWFSRRIGFAIRRLARYIYRTFIDIDVEGIYFRSRINDNVSERNFVFMPWNYDHKEREYIATYLPRDGIFLDIGANVGIYSLWAAKFLGSSGRVVCFEPNPPVFDRLVFNVRINEQSRGADWPSFNVLNLGVSDRSGEFELYLNPSNLGQSSLVVRTESAKSVKIFCVSLLEKLQELNVPRVDILKIDVEGAEEDALLPFLESCSVGLRPKSILIENSDHLWKTNLRQKLLDYGYTELLKTKMNSVFSIQTK
jgi:FkbM family methyltransferase